MKPAEISHKNTTATVDQAADVLNRLPDELQGKLERRFI
jgi:hypothetical protein